MKKDLIRLINIFFLFIIISPNVKADDFLLPDWNFYSYREKIYTYENSEFNRYEKIRKEFNFDIFFDKQTITIYKKEKLTPQEFGNKIFSNILIKDKNAEKYILSNDKICFFGAYCSPLFQKCEIIKIYNGFDGLIEIRYTHNNLWHFQNNMGSFIEFQNRIEHSPYEFTFKKLTNKNYWISL